MGRPGPRRRCVAEFESQRPFRGGSATMGDMAVLIGVGGYVFFFSLFCFRVCCIPMAKKDSGPKADDADDFDPALEQFIQSMDFATVPGSNEGWHVVFADILTYALFRVFPSCALRAQADPSVRCAGT